MSMGSYTEEYAIPVEVLRELDEICQIHEEQGLVYKDYEEQPDEDCVDPC